MLLLFTILSLLFCIACLLAVGFNLQDRGDRRLASSPAFSHRYSLGSLVLLILFPPRDFASELSEDRE